MPKRTLPIFIVITLLMLFSSCTCIYFNTFHNIRKNFYAAEKSRTKDGRDIARGGETKQYNDAIDKAARVLERHPNSSWVDDALYIIGASYYYLEDYSKASRKFKELLANYPQSEFVPESRLLLAKSKLKLKEETEAIVLFEEIFEKAKKKEMKAEAARSLGEYYFELGNYDNANTYFLSLIDSLGEDRDKLRAYMYVADGYYERFNFSSALDNYEKALKHNPDTLQEYTIKYRLAECDYFLFDIERGLERLQKLSENQLFYDSLASIRMKMAEGFEWEGRMEEAISTYERITVENPGRDVAAQAYYELGLIYQYDFEDLAKAREFYIKARDEKRGNSPVKEDATKRASRLVMLEQFTESTELENLPDSTEQLDPDEIEKMSENHLLLGELFYLDLDKPDSALNAYQELLNHFPQSSHAPQALMAMAYIYKNEFADTARSDSLLRRILKEYAHYDEAEEVIDVLGLSGTIADTGYAAIVFRKAETFLNRFQNLDRQWYFPFEVRYEPPVDTTPVIEDETASDVIAEEHADESPEEQTASSVFVPDTARIDVVPAQEQETKVNTQIESVGRTIDPEQAQDSTASKRNTRRDEIMAMEGDRGGDTNADDEEDDDEGEVADSTNHQAGQNLLGGGQSEEPIRLTDLLRGDTPPSLDSLNEQTDTAGIVIDSLPEGLPPEVIDSIFATRKNVSTDSVAIPTDTASNLALIDSLAVDSLDSDWVDPDLPVDTVARTDKYYAALSLIDSARYYYQYVVDSFPHSEYSIQARYLLLWTYDKYFAPGDSALIDLYSAFVDSFPASPYTAFIADEYKIRPSANVLRQQREDQKKTEDALKGETPEQSNEQVEDTTSTSDLYGTPEYSFITDEDGNEMKKANEYFVRSEYTFKYPLEAVSLQIDADLYFQIRIDFNGEVDEVVLKNKTDSPELNEQAIETVKRSKFDPGRIPPELYDTWFYYIFEVRVPAELRQ
ncbi:MAG: tetratricopeptide repeat protein [Candidatus Zixiibacteriota bacterium]